MIGQLTAQGIAQLRGVLGDVTGQGLSDAERIDLLAEIERLKASCTAAQARLAVAFHTSAAAAIESGERHRQATLDAAGSRQEIPVTARGIRRLVHHSVTTQLGLAMRCSPARAAAFLSLAQRLVGGELRGTMTGLSDGLISEEKARLIGAQLTVMTDRPEGERPSSEVIATVESQLASAAPTMGIRELERAARRTIAHTDPASVIARMEQAAHTRRVTLRPAPDGMAYLSILGPLADSVGAYAALRQRADSIAAGAHPDISAAGRGRGALMCDTALEQLSGRAPGQVQALEIQLVMPAQTLLKGAAGHAATDIDEPAELVDFGPLPAAIARALVNADLPPGSGSPPSRKPAMRWLRRLYTSPDGCQLIAMDSQRRTFGGLLRQYLTIRDGYCRNPFCDNPISQFDHVKPARAGGATTDVNGQGLCSRCHTAKEAPGWRHDITTTGRTDSGAHRIRITTPTGHTYDSTAPPLLGRRPSRMAVAFKEHRECRDGEREEERQLTGLHRDLQWRLLPALNLQLTYEHAG